MSRTHRASAPWARRAQRGELPASDRTGLIATDRETLATLGATRITISGRAYTVADLQRAMAREDGSR